ncbi:MAG: hypothetical protein Q4C82_06360 [Eubacteriales bacterium]|nr:hypothetical protein [Eubacteriales bacterium]
MISEADRAVLDESCRTARTGREAIHAVIGKVEDEDLALDLNRQACRFVQLEEKVQREYAKERLEPPKDSVMDRTKVWGGIRMNTLLDAGTGRLAERMIQENARGIAQLGKAVKGNQTARREYCELAREIMDFEEKNIEKLKAYLQ